MKGGAYGWDEATMNPRGLNINYGVPYLVIKPNILNSPNPEATQPILIQMQPVKFSKKSKQYGAIKDLYDNVSTIEFFTGVQLGTEDFAAIVRNYAHTEFEIDTLAGNDSKRVLKLKNNVTSILDYFPNLDSSVAGQVEGAIQSLVPLVFSPELKTLYFSTEKEAEKYIQENGTPHSTHTTDMIINGHLVVGVAKVKDKREL